MSQAGRRSQRERRGRPGAVNASFVLSAAASAGLTVLYALGGQPQLEGALILVALGAMAVGLILWERRFLPQGPYVQAREPLPSTPLERKAFAEDFEVGAEAIGRRTFIARLFGLALGALGVAAILPIRSLGPSPGRSLFVTEWRRGSRVVKANNQPVKVADLNVSKVCTHAGCPVGLYEQQTGRLFCPCHQSVFDAMDGAKPLSGPATRPLPQLALEVDPEGFLRARHDFTEPVGPGFWNEGHVS